MSVGYRDAGVDIDQGDELVERIKPYAKATRIREVVSDVGGFSGMCAVPSDIEDPVMVSGTDGVGTKLKLAFATNRHDTIGIDLVAMCVNDILTTGARPLFFLDYFATGKLDLAQAEAVIRSIADGCKEAGCALLGGETAELPGFYAGGEYDLAGFAVGVVARKKIIDGKRIAAGNVVIALPSSGVHSNGYSLVRKIIPVDAMKEKPASLGGESLEDALLRPTKIYTKAVTEVLRSVDVLGMSHITGGGLPGNLPRILPDGLGVDCIHWDVPALFELLRERGPVDLQEMRRVYNMGVGFVMIVDAKDETSLTEGLVRMGEKPFRLGTIVERPVETPFEERVRFAN